MYILEGRFSGLWSARDVLYFHCETCGQHLPWKKYTGSNVLMASCCGFIYGCEPIDSANRFRIFVKDCDLSNVILLSRIDCDYSA